MNTKKPDPEVLRIAKSYRDSVDTVKAQFIAENRGADIELLTHLLDLAFEAGRAQAHVNLSQE